MHPIRGEVFITDFKGAAVKYGSVTNATDHKVPETHTALTNRGRALSWRCKGRQGRYEPKAATGMRSPSCAADEREPTGPSSKSKMVFRCARSPREANYCVHGGQVQCPGQDPKGGAGLLGRGAENPINRSISTPVPNHDGVVAGIDPANPGHKAFAAVNMADVRPGSIDAAHFRKNFANLASTSPPAPGGSVRRSATPSSAPTRASSVARTRVSASFSSRRRTRSPRRLRRLHHRPPDDQRRPRR